MNPQAAFREVNDSIREMATGDLATDVFEFLCECPDIECHKMVSLTLREFDERRAASSPVPILTVHEDDQIKPSAARKRLAAKSK